MLAAGSKVTDKVRLVRKLGEGGMGNVWVADHLTLRSQVAVKFVSLERAEEDPTIVARFMAEASLSARIKSPHVVKTFDHGVTDDGVPYIVMELLDGETLRERLERAGALGTWETAVLLRQICKALTSAHGEGVVHRDIKPDNVFLVGGDESDFDPEVSSTFGDQLFVKLLDFGLAKQTHPLSYGLETSIGAMVGTPAYMSPEQALSQRAVDHRADLWAAAVVAYHAVTGRLPFVGETLGALCVALEKSSYTPASEAHSALPPALDDFFAQAFHRDIAQRFQTARDMALAFARAVRSEQPSLSSDPGRGAFERSDARPTPTPLVASLARRAPARRTRWVAALLVLLGGGAALTALSISGSGSEAAAPASAPQSEDAPSEHAPRDDAPSQDPPSEHQSAPSKHEDAPPEDAPAAASAAPVETATPDASRAAPPAVTAARRPAPPVAPPPAPTVKARNWGF